MQQFVYSHRFSEPLSVSQATGAEFRLLSSPWEAFRIWKPMVLCFGWYGFVKAAVKLLTGKRWFYCMIAEGEVAHYGWVSLSFCRYYHVQAGDVVVGPIWTDDRFRGRGYATRALKLVVNGMIQAGHRVVWIDTTEDNEACQKVIEKCGFGRHVSSYERDIS